MHARRAVRSDLPVVVISGHAEQEFDRLRQLEGVVALSKPFSMARLAATLEKLVARRSTS